MLLLLLLNLLIYQNNGSFFAKVLVYPSGYVLWVPCSIFQSSCSIDVLYFPFDEQTCEMIFGSWTYNSKEVNLSAVTGAFAEREMQKLLRVQLLVG